MKFILFFSRLVILGIIGFLSAFLYFLLSSHYLSPKFIEHPLSMLFVGIFSTLIFLKPVDRWLASVASVFIPKKQSGGFNRLKKLTRSLLFEKELVPASNLFINSLSEEFHLQSAAVFLKRNDRFLPVAFQGYELDAFKGLRLTKASHLIQVISQKPEGLKGLGLREPMPQDMNTLCGELYRLKSAYVFPVFEDEELFGFLSIGFKAEEEPTKEEIRFIKSLLPTLSSIFFILNELSEVNEKLKNLPDLQSNLLQTAKYSALEQLATGIAHEIHNPLTIISGKAQVLLLRQSKRFNSKQVEEVLHTIVQQTKRASDVTRKLLMFTKAGKAEKEVLDLETVLKDTLSLISYQISLDQVTIEKNISPHLGKVKGNQNEIREIFMNLILNAIKATPEKGRVRISLRNNSSGDKIELCVEDSGSGIPKEDMEKIFDPFYTSAHENSGLGLYITERLVFKNRGTIYAESEEGRGSLFVVELPYEDSKEITSKQVVSEVV